MGKQPKVKIKKLKNVDVEKYGRVFGHNVNKEPHEYKTVIYLTTFGIDVEFLQPSNIPHSLNPDIEMFGTVWEMKSPISNNKLTLETTFRKAIHQANGRAVFDLRNVKCNSDEIEKYILKMFIANREMKRIIMIKKNGDCLDFIK